MVDRRALSAAVAFGLVSVALLRRWSSPSSARLNRHLRWVRRARFASLQREMTVAIELAIACGEAMLATVGAHATLKDGKDGIDPQTATDLANEKLVMETLAAAFPAHVIIGEETAAATRQKPKIGASPTWIVDPIDGTQNFCHGVPLSCVSIGHCIGGKPELGVIYDPWRDELFVGVASEGAYVNGMRMHAKSDCQSLDKAMVVTDVGYERSPKGARRLAACHEALLLANTFGVRIIGSTVLALAWLSAGRSSAVYMGVGQKDCPKPWDWCAAWAIGRACGVTFLRLGSDAPFDLNSQSVVAAGHEGLAKELQRTLCAALVQVA